MPHLEGTRRTDPVEHRRHAHDAPLMHRLPSIYPAKCRPDLRRTKPVPALEHARTHSVIPHDIDEPKVTNTERRESHRSYRQSYRDLLEYVREVAYTDTRLGKMIVILLPTIPARKPQQDRHPMCKHDYLLIKTAREYTTKTKKGLTPEGVCPFFAPVPRHCERSEAISGAPKIASSLRSSQ